jgi:superfamily I DNA and RNA helicase
MLDTVIGDRKNVVASDLLLQTLLPLNLTGTVYVGYPVIASSGTPVFIEALLTCLEHGIVVFDFPGSINSEQAQAKAMQRHDDLYLAVELQLKRQSTGLVANRRLTVDINVLSFFPQLSPNLAEAPEFATPRTLPIRLQGFSRISEGQLRGINAAIQRVTSIRPAAKRTEVTKPESFGSTIQKIEREIANLDSWQKAAAIEMPEGPQRIRGLAGSGKTIVLALKAAYLHARHPEWTIGVTFHTRSLYQQFRSLVTRFSLEQLGDEPDWTKLLIIHSWGSTRQPGLYSLIAGHAGQPIRDFMDARASYGRDKAFDGVCQELEQAISEVPFEPIFDALLIDEAQDFPTSFFQLAYLATKPPKKVTWAYDELQNLSQYQIAPPSELFGEDASGHPNVSELVNRPNQAKQDIVLPVCYRNTPWALTTAHAIGFGVYREGGLIQWFNDPEVWDAVGYEVKAGALVPDSYVDIARRPEASPPYFAELMKDEVAVQWQVFGDAATQAENTVRLIKRNLEEDELRPSDILVIFPDPRRVPQDASMLIKALEADGLRSHIAGVTSSVDELFIEDSIAITGIYRAKGNEAPMVYILDCQYCFGGLGLIRKRNILFTALTRSRAWVRLFGYGDDMQRLCAEFIKVREHAYHLQFTVPSAETLSRLRRLHRDRPPEDEKRLKNLTSNVDLLLDLMAQGEIEPEDLPPSLVERLQNLLGKM